jgi:tetratricopeptide (TPR) repeat protein
VILLKQGKTQEAVQHFSQALGADPAYKKAAANLEYALKQAVSGKGDLDMVQLFDMAGMIPMEDQSAALFEVPLKKTAEETGWDFQELDKTALLNLLKYLMDLAEYLPPEAKEEFIQSDIQSGLRYIIDTLEKPADI